MIKNIFYTALACMLFAACKKDNNQGGGDNTWYIAGTKYTATLVSDTSPGSLIASNLNK